MLTKALTSEGCSNKHLTSLDHESFLLANNNIEERLSKLNVDGEALSMASSYRDNITLDSIIDKLNNCSW